MSTYATCQIQSHDSVRALAGHLLARSRGSIRCTTQQALVVLCEAASIGGLEVQRDGGGYDWPELTADAVAAALTDRSAYESDLSGHVDVDRDESGAITCLRWRSTFTAGRTVEARPGGAELRWSTGTGLPSRYIGQALERAGLATVARSEVARFARLGGVSPTLHGQLAGIAV